MAAGKEKIFLGRSQTLKTAFGEFKKVAFGPDDLKRMLNQVKQVSISSLILGLRMVHQRKIYHFNK